MKCAICKNPIAKGQKYIKHPEYGELHLSCVEAENKKRDAIDLEIAKVQEQIEFEEAKTCYWKYVALTHKFDKKFKISKFQKYICDCIDKLINNELLNDKGEPYEGITVSIPGQHGKSRCITETLPSYYLGKNPYDHVIEVSYSDDLANTFGRRNKEKIEEFGGKLFDIKLSETKSSAEEFELENTKGGMLSRGIGGGLSGKPSDLTIVDDPYKNRQDADSPSYKQFVINEWLNVIRIRASAKCKYIIVHTRWNEDDLIGYLLDTEPNKWFEIRFPLECEEPEPITGRQPGDALLPEAGKDNKWLKNFKSSFLSDPTGGGIRAWNALMQQRPSSVEGNLIKRTYWKRYKLSLAMQKGEGLDEMIQSWDCSFKDTSTSDRVAGGVWGRKGADCYLMDIKYDRLDIVRTMEAIIEFARKYPKALAKLIEDKANGPAVIQMMRTKVPGLIPVKATKSKEERVNAVLPVWESENVYIPSEIEVRPGIWVPCSWSEQVIDQCAAFKPGKKVQADDLVDMCSQALNRLMYSFVKNPGKKIPDGFYTETEKEDLGIKSMEPRRAKVVNLF